MKIAFLINELLLGGAQRLVVDLSHSLQAQGHEIVIVTWVDEEKEFGADAKTLYDFCQQANIRTHRLRQGGWRRWRELATWLRRERPEVLHTHLTYSGIMGRVVGRFAHIPCIVSTLHNTPDTVMPRARLMDRWTFWCADSITCVNEEIERAYFSSAQLYQGGAQRVRRSHVTILNGIPFERFFAEPTPISSKPAIGIVARLLDWKGQDTLIQALSYLRQDVPTAHVQIVGWGPYEETLKELVKTLHLESHVTFLGAKDDVRTFLKGLDIFCIPYRETTFHIEGNPGISMLEAMAAGKPTVTSFFPGLDRSFVQGKEIIYVRQNDPYLVFLALKELIEHPDRARELARAGQEKARQLYAIEVTARTYETLYQSILSSSV